MKMKSPLIRFLAGGGLLAVASLCLAGEPFPGQPPDGQLVSTQEKAADLFERSDYERALFIYRHELAPRGDKFAQYMVGYMYASGRGVDTDVVEASAWYQLAAERGEKSFVKVHDNLWEGMSEEEQIAATDRHAALQAELSDRVVVVRLIEKDILYLRTRNSNQLTINSGFGQQTTERLSDYKRACRRLEQRLRYLERSLEHDTSVTDADREYLDALRQEAELEMTRFEDSLN